MILTDTDKEILTARGITEAQVLAQFNALKEGIDYVDLRAPATDEDGIVILDKSQQDKYVKMFEEKKETLDLLKFTPASGAATRMFRFLFEFLEGYDREEGSINAYINKNGVLDLRLFFVGIDDFPFFPKVRKRLKKKFKKNKSIDINLNRQRFVEIMLDKEELDLGSKPKGLFPFHCYKHHIATAFEEHLFEAALYANNNGIANLHFTISKNHQELFTNKFEKRRLYIEEKTGVKFNIEYSYQEENTDTIAITNTGKLVRDNEGLLLFRPGGHGSLINNLNEQNADIIFIKNIDNVVVCNYKEEIAYYKKMLAGKLLTLQRVLFSYLERIDKEDSISESEILEMVHFLQEELKLRLTPDFEKFSRTYKIAYLREELNKPLRVCGMVKNEGEPGGGPFWVRSENGRESLQIVESVQVDPTNELQQKVLKKASHFNPVDIVCGIKDYKGNTFDLHKFVDPRTGFITSKSYNGKKIKALEHPGLWNGAMAHWNTVFVEVPLVTFNPVKTVNDLLKPLHQV